MSRIPLDVQDCVMDNLPVEVLGPCCLVSLYWLARLRPRYLADRTVRLNGEQRYHTQNQAFIELLHAEYSTFPRYIGNVYIRGPEEHTYFRAQRFGIERGFRYIKDQYYYMEEKLIPELSPLINVVQFSLSHIKWEQLDGKSREILQSLQNKSVKRLALKLIKFPSLFEALSFWVGPSGLSPHLQSLELREVDFNDLREDIEWTFPSSLHELHLTFTGYADNALVSCVSNSRPKIRVLEVKSIESETDVSETVRLLTHLSFTLTTISLDVAEYACEEGLSQSSFTLPISFEHTPNLQSLEVTGFPLYPFENYEVFWLNSMIQSIRSTSFASLTLGFWLTPGEHSSLSRALMINFDFLPIEAALLSRDHVPRLSLVLGQSAIWTDEEMSSIREDVKSDLWRMNRQNSLEVSFTGGHENMRAAF